MDDRLSDRPTDRLWTRPVTLTDDERSQIRLTLERNPSLLDAPILAALSHIEHGDAMAAQIIATIRGGERCEP